MNSTATEFRHGLPGCPRCGRPGRVLGDLGNLVVLACRNRNHRNAEDRQPFRFYAERDNGDNPPLRADGTAPARPARRGAYATYDPDLIELVVRLRRDEGLAPGVAARRAGVSYDVVRRIWNVHVLGQDPNKKRKSRAKVPA